MNIENIKSPITGLDNVKCIKSVLTKNIITDYKKVFNIDTEKYFSNTKEIYFYKCLDSGYQFYTPFDTAGDDFFYEKLEKFDWYYMKYKWENFIAEKYIKDGDRVLEVGCARGDFLKRISSKKNVSVEGLELNSAAAKKAEEQGVTAHVEFIEDFSKNNQDKYDVICTFQVLEHISNPKSFIDSCLSALKKGGLLIIGVPNNDSFISKDANPLLDMPPHHMGIYHEDTFKKFEKHFPLQLERLEIEPLQKYHVGYYVYILIGQYLTKFGILGKVINKIAFIIMYPVLRVFSKMIKGHTMVAIYRKV